MTGRPVLLGGSTGNGNAGAGSDIDLHRIAEQSDPRTLHDLREIRG